MTLPWILGILALLLALLCLLVCVGVVLVLYQLARRQLVPQYVEKHAGCWYLRNLETGEARRLMEGTTLLVAEAPANDRTLV